MISYDLDPSLHTAQPEPPVLDDGFSRPQHDTSPEQAQPADELQHALPAKSDF